MRSSLFRTIPLLLLLLPGSSLARPARHHHSGTKSTTRTHKASGRPATTPSTTIAADSPATTTTAVPDVPDTPITTFPSTPVTSSIPNPPSTGNTSGIFKPPMSVTWLYELDHTPVPAPVRSTDSGLKLNQEIYVVDMEQSTAEQIAQYKAEGKHVICYFCAGSWESGRTDSASFNPTCHCGAGVSSSSSGACTGSQANLNKMDGWDEWWLDLHSEECIADAKEIMGKRMERAKAKGCDGVDPDNVDSYTNTQSYGNTKQDEVDYLLWLSETAHGLGLSISLKNANELLVSDSGGATEWQASLVEAFDFNLIESCHKYDECDKYSSFLAAGKPQLLVEYGGFDSCPALKDGQRLMVYSGTNLDSTQVVLNC